MKFTITGINKGEYGQCVSGVVLFSKKSYDSILQAL